MGFYTTHVSSMFLKCEKYENLPIDTERVQDQKGNIRVNLLK
jgi:hypothetical protein